MCECTTECISRTEPTDKFDFAWRNAHTFSCRCQHHTFGPEFDYRKFNAVAEKRVGNCIRVRLADRHLAFGSIANNHRAVCDRLSCGDPCIFDRSPKARSVVEIYDRVSFSVAAGKPFERRFGGFTIGECATAHPKNCTIFDQIVRYRTGINRGIWGVWLAVKNQLWVFWWVERCKHDWCQATWLR